MTSKTTIADGEIHTLCRQCDLRCALSVVVSQGRIVRVAGLQEGDGRTSRICAKATAIVDMVYHRDRLLTAYKRREDGTFSPLPISAAMEEIAARVQRIKDRHGARALGVWTGEAVGFFQQEEYARRFIHAFGSPNFFSADSVCFSARYIGYHLVQGYWNTVPDFERARAIVLWGANLGVSHPPYMRAIEKAQARGASLVVVDPIRSDAARRADFFLQLRPGTDGALAWGLARQLLERKAYDAEFVQNYCSGFDAFVAYARSFTPQRVEELTGVEAAAVEAVATLLARAQPQVVNYAGIALEHQANAVNTIRTIACLGGLCGAVDRQGGDPWPLPPRVRSLALYEDRPLERQEPIGAARYPLLYQFRRQCHSLTAMDYMLGRGSYPLRGLVITGANPVLTNPNSAKVARALASLDLLVVRDLFMTATARLADYVLPAASFLERSELHYWIPRQTMGLSPRVLEVAGTQGEYEFWRDLAHRLGFGPQYFPWKDEEEVNRWITEPAGIDLEELGSRPQGYRYLPQEYEKYRRRPFATASGTFEFCSDRLEALGYPALPEYQPPQYWRRPDPDFPLVLITGVRKPLYYHSRLRNIQRLRRGAPRPEVEMHPDDVEALGLRPGDRVRVVSKVGAIELAVKVLAAGDILPGVVQITHGWDEANVNLLTDDTDTDPLSGFPNLKAVMVRVEKAGSCTPET